MKVMDMKLLPILFYGCHLWECENSSVAWLINSAFRKGVQRGLGLGKFESIRDLVASGFQETAVRAKMLKLKFLQRAAMSINYFLVKGLFILVVDKKLQVQCIVLSLGGAGREGVRHIKALFLFSVLLSIFLMYCPWKELHQLSGCEINKSFIHSYDQAPCQTEFSFWIVVKWVLCYFN